MLKLIDKGMTREAAYDLVQPKTALLGIIGRLFVHCWKKTKNSFRFEPSRHRDAFDYQYHLVEYRYHFERNWIRSIRSTGSVLARFLLEKRGKNDDHGN